MTDEESFAVARGSVDKLNRLADLASAGHHDDIYLKVQDDVVNALMSTGGSFLSYVTFDASYFAELDGDAEAFVAVEKYQNYLQQADPEGTIEMEFLGDEDESADHPRLADHWKARGAMNVQIRLPGSEDDLSVIPWNLPNRFTSDHQYISEQCLDDDGNPPEDPDDLILPPTRIDTTAETIQQKIIDKADFADVGYYPVVVEEGTLRLELDNNDDQIWGDIEAGVEGPDVSNVYNTGFKELFGVLEGDVSLATAPSPADQTDAPLVVTQETENYIGRHIIGSYSKPQ